MILFIYLETTTLIDGNEQEVYLEYFYLLGFFGLKKYTTLKKDLCFGAGYDKFFMK